jgi:hypothetical protein
LGGQFRAENVPVDFLASVGLAYTFLKRVTVSDGYRLSKGMSGPDVDTAHFAQSREIRHNVEASVGVTDGGGRYYQFFYARTFAGRNTGERDLFGAAITLPF